MAAPVLLPCPFCGGKPVLTHGASNLRERTVECDDCFAQGSFEWTDEEAVSAWNRRTPAVPADQRPTSPAR